ncbi:MBL fold metallo-hydrolase [Nevskia sp.]|uniref:MBL fold metallo-hydrolase n=1 Tax=Nevskia sp. TaxID=1929292 RepID=UPI0025FB7D41|nr:MBL fold metallo-hydrolase [Nevskia sp.]
MKIVEAVTAVLICEGEIYLTHRQPHLTAFPGFMAFPGGKVDKGEAEHLHAHPLLAEQTPRHVHALARELREELDYDLDAALAADEVLAIDKLGTALSPPFLQVRFDTGFFAIRLRSKPEFTIELGELAGGAWKSTADWLADFERGDLLLAPPTLDVLRHLAERPDATTIDRLRDYNEVDGIPEIEPLRGVLQMPVRSNTLPPADRTNCFQIGDQGSPILLIDPSPANRAEFDKLCRHVAGRGISEVFLTHHHPDHCQYANDLARHLGVPIAMSADTFERISRRVPTFFDGLTVKTYADGDVATSWLGHPLRVVAVPGHDEGQLALMPDNRAFCIVGDLIQGVGTVVISPPEGDMAKYFATLEKVIALGPKVIWPSHGTALGGTYYLELTLKHRRAREAQVKTLFEAGRSIDQMLAEMYVGTDPRLMPLARINIEGHLAKLRSEGALQA